jgi:hypothetical protein
MAQELLEAWRTEEDFERRDELLEELYRNKVFPQEFVDDWEKEGGLYPGLDDMNFVPKLMRKQEYQELKQPSVKESLATGVDKCRSSEDFELSPVQRFVSRLLNPRTPYHSALLYHGVGVGKTCAAVTICESYLEQFPGRKAFVVAPPNIQDGFRRTIFDINSCSIPKDPKAKNIHRGCTGEIYLRLSNCLYEKDKDVIQNRITRVINQRYQFFGYSSLYNYIREKTSHISSELDDAETQKRAVYRRIFANRVVIIDEAHNLRDNPTESEEDTADDASIQDTSDAKAGKKLTPFLRQVLSSAEDITLVLMTATPMYNSYVEIIFLLNLLLLNDKRPELRIDDVFDRGKQEFTPEGRKILGKIASTYVSFMRGENPLTFPLRLEPETSDRLIEWPSESPTGDVLTEDERDRCIRLPVLECFLEPEMEDAYKNLSDEIVNSREGLGITNMDTLVQAGNWIFPAEGSSDILDRIRQPGFDNVFTKEVKGKSVQFRSTLVKGAQWLLEDNLPAASGKCAVLLDRLNKTRGVAFVYSRFVASGALTIALALEANGYLPWGRDSGLLANGNQHESGKQCALCPRHDKGHGEVGEEDGVPKHTFKQARYVLLTGNKELSPSNPDSVTAARGMSNVNGEEIKVVIGSQVAGEGLDLRFIREIMVFDSWYHLNKLEQIVGRGIRNCSHAELPKEKRNCTVSLLVNSFASTQERETADMYSYRLALNKARSVGNVTRVLKEFALDCSLNREAILVSGLDPLKRILDSQGKVRADVNINDVPLTPLCDWLDDCEYQCYSGNGSELVEEISLEQQDSSTYDEYTAQFQMNKIRKFLQDFMSRNQAIISFEQIANSFTSIPRVLLSSLLNEMVLQKDFTITTDRGEGRILYRNGYYLFQPELIQDTRIPIAIRLANIPISRDRYLPNIKEEEETKTVAIDEEEDSEALWEEVLTWVDQMRNGSLQYATKAARSGKKQVEYSVPESLRDEVNRLRASVGIDKVQKERLEVIVNLYDKIKTNDGFRRVFADVVLEYMWDEFITYGTKKHLLLQDYNNEEKRMKQLNPTSYFMYDGVLYLRLLNTNTNKTEWFYKPKGLEEMKQASAAIQEFLEKEPDPILAKPLNKTTTGFIYGFLHFNPKKKKVVFKKAEAPNVGGPAPRGEECANVSNIRNQREQLKRFASALKEAGMPTFQLDDDGVLLKIENSVRICTVVDIVLRCMDKVKLQNKRWFYKELEAKAYKHPLV